MATMFWQLFLAHLLADYPLQTDWVVSVKRQWNGLVVHIGTHLGVMAVILGDRLIQVWPYVVGLGGIHLGIDIWKSKFSQRYPKLQITAYLIDQLLHFTSILLIAWLIGFEASGLLSETVIIYAIGYLLVSYVWYVTDRICAHTDPIYQQFVQRCLWSRLIARCSLLTTLCFAPTYPFVAVMLFTFLDWPYMTNQFRRRIWVTDVGVVMLVFGLVQWLLLSG